jgi:hypothetical protein
MRQFLIIATISAFTFSACSQQKKVTAKQTTVTNAQASPLGNIDEAPTKKTVGKTTYVKMQRTPCFGRCPYYTLEFYDNGLVRYTGLGDTEYMGAYEKQMEAKKIKDVLKQFDAYRVDTCQKEYEALITDVPGLNYWVSRGEDQNTIRYANFGPAFLEVLGNQMDNTAKPDKTWKKVADDRN